jgi:hypothetical protein
MMFYLVLRLIGFDRSFEVHTNASDKALSRVLKQVGHLVAFKSKKLNNTKQKYLRHEKEMIMIVYYLGIWKVYLLG